MPTGWRGALASLLIGAGWPETALRRRAAQRLTVLAYHRIGPPPAKDYPFDPEVFSATPEEFDRELQYVRRCLDVLSVGALLRALREGSALPERPALITFDDGYRDNLEIAAPLLAARGLSACFFLCTRIVDTRRIPWWDGTACCFQHARTDQMLSPFGEDDPPYDFRPAGRRDSLRRFLRNLKTAPWPEAERHLQSLCEATGVAPEEFATEPLFMSWDGARALLRTGMEVGSHTQNHPLLGRMSSESQLREEIAGSHADLSRETGEAPVAFAYPVGSEAAMSPEADAEIARAGYEISFSYQHGFAPLGGAARFRLPRIHAEFGQDFNAFRLELARAPLPGQAKASA